jgi:hypothetical protein
MLIMFGNNYETAGACIFEMGESKKKIIKLEMNVIQTWKTATSC